MAEKEEGKIEISSGNTGVLTVQLLNAVCNKLDTLIKEIQALKKEE